MLANDLSSIAEHDIRNHFLRKLAEFSVKTVCGRSYVRIEELRDWMLDLSLLDNGTTNVEVLLERCHDKGGSEFAAPASAILDEPRRCLDVFAILLEIDRGHLVEQFQSFGIIDSKLPVNLAALESVLERGDFYPEIAREFNRAQWKYRPLMFNMDDDLNEPGNRIIPICEKDLIKKGGTATVHRILIEERFVHAQLKNVLRSSVWDDRVFGKCYMLALKTYHSDNKRLFDNETNAFRGLRDNDGMIKCLLWYSHIELDTYDDGGEEWTTQARGNSTHNIVLVMGKYDLQGFLGEFNPPALTEEISGFWSSVFLLAKAVKDIHNFEAHSANFSEPYYGCHADIKPENILMVGDDFKLADPGFARFNKYANDTSSAKSGLVDFWGGTTTFGAPECHLVDQRSRSERSILDIKITPTIDIWSLGCVFSVVATWVVLGIQGVEQFTEFRRQAISQSRTANQDLPAGSDLAKPGQNDFFHDGHQVLTQITEWHRLLRGSIRKCDAITGNVLDLVEGRMLVNPAEDRISAAQLDEQLNLICGRPEAVQASDASQNLRDIIGKQESIYQKARENRNTQVSELERNLSHIEQSLDELDANRSDVASQLTTSLINRARQSVLVMKEKITSEQAFDSGLRDSNGYAVSKQTSHRSRVIKRSSISRSTRWPSLPNVIEEPPFREVMKPGHQNNVDSPKSSALHIVTSPVSEPALELQTSDPFFPTSSSSGLTRTLSRFYNKTKRIIRKPKKPDDRLRKFFSNRDIIFVVDNAGTMRQFWSDVKKLLFDLVTLAQNVNTHGMDLYFTYGHAKFSPTNDPAAFVKAMEKRDDQPVENVETDMSKILGRLLTDYLDRFKRADQHKGVINPPREATIIVLTNGLWREMSNDILVDNQIVHFSEQLCKIRGKIQEADRQLSIQFVQFGDDRAARHRLKRLDDDLVFRGVHDIVDTRPANDDLHKILLGSLIPSIDDEVDATEESAIDVEGFSCED